MASAINPSKEFPHPNPSFAYIGGPARGSKAPTKERNTVFAASAEAEYMVNVSTKYVEIGNCYCQDKKR
jgi:hypothetical protein